MIPAVSIRLRDLAVDLVLELLRALWRPFLAAVLFVGGVGLVGALAYLFVWGLK